MQHQVNRKWHGNIVFLISANIVTAADKIPNVHSYLILPLFKTELKQVTAC